jgi:hypothetical protein
VSRETDKYTKVTGRFAEAAGRGSTLGRRPGCGLGNLNAPLGFRLLCVFRYPTSADVIFHAFIASRAIPKSIELRDSQCPVRLRNAVDTVRFLYSWLLHPASYVTEHLTCTFVNMHQKSLQRVDESHLAYGDHGFEFLYHYIFSLLCRLNTTITLAPSNLAT